MYSFTSVFIVQNTVTIRCPVYFQMDTNERCPKYLIHFNLYKNLVLNTHNHYSCHIK